LERRRQATSLRAALDSLPDKERTMLRAVYFEGLTIERAGKSMGLSKSWASRLHARALQLARDALPAEA
jgi:RNA polymerase sigma factor for flagellar operon FliA